MTMTGHAIFFKKLTSGLENDMKNLANFQLKASKLKLSWDPFHKNRKCMS